MYSKVTEQIKEQYYQQNYPNFKSKYELRDEELDKLDSPYLPKEEYFFYDDPKTNV